MERQDSAEIKAVVNCVMCASSGSQSACVAIDISSHVSSYRLSSPLLVNNGVASAGSDMSYQVLEESFSSEKDMIESRPKFWLGEDSGASSRIQRQNRQVIMR